MRHLASVVATCLTLLAFVAPVHAGLYWVVENQSDQVFTVDVNTQTATLVGPAGVNWGFGGLGFAQDGNLYAWNTNPGNLYSVNQGNGSMTLIGGSSLFGADTFDINPVTNEAIAWSVSGSLNDVNLANGATTFRVNTSPSNPGIASAFGPDGTLYVMDRSSDLLYSVDINTGVLTLIGALGFNANGTNLGFNPDDGFLYTINIQDANYPLFRINPLTGVGIFVGNVSGLPNNSNQQITAGTFQIAAVPEPASMLAWGLITGVGLVGYRLRRRKLVA